MILQLTTFKLSLLRMPVPSNAVIQKRSVSPVQQNVLEVLLQNLLYHAFGGNLDGRGSDVKELHLPFPCCHDLLP